MYKLDLQVFPCLHLCLPCFFSTHSCVFIGRAANDAALLESGWCDFYRRTGNMGHKTHLHFPQPGKASPPPSPSLSKHEDLSGKMCTRKDATLRDMARSHMKTRVMSSAEAPLGEWNKVPPSAVSRRVRPPPEYRKLLLGHGLSTKSITVHKRTTQFLSSQSNATTSFSFPLGGQIDPEDSRPPRSGSSICLPVRDHISQTAATGKAAPRRSLL